MNRGKQTELFNLIRSAKVYDLEFDRFTGMPGFFPGQPQYFYMLNMRHEDEYDLSANGLRTGSAGILLMVDHSGTHIDALCHMASELRLYDGSKITKEVQTPTGFTKLGAETIKPILSRGILLDVANSLNYDTLPEEYLITVDDVVETCKKQQTTIQPGDSVLVRTGYGRHWNDAAKYSRAAGVSLEASLWIADKKPILVGADNMTWEVPKIRDKQTNTTAPAHWQLMALKGIYIIENLFLEELARDRVYEFLFVALPIKLKGATGSPLRPIAVVV
ncbi:MAG: cyclase family protein [Candidatus Caldarchaeum sp.]|nr:cyclase family protein [Candidatus Caldarchaeum sp.]